MAKGQAEGLVDETITYSTGDVARVPDIRLLHYNDVYHVDASSAEPVGGVARFQTLCNYYRDDVQYEGQPKMVTLFSGDAFNPSLESGVTRGAHMVPLLNKIGTDAACVGNHDLDFGIPQFQKLISKCTFPWLLANVLDPVLGDDVPLGNVQKTFMITTSNGIKVGLIGIVEREWLDTINTLPPNLVYKSASATVTELAPGLRKEGADIVIVLSHQREPNDVKLAKGIPAGLVDMILGGHDHYYQHNIINDVHILRSGTDFKQLSYVEGRRRTDKGWNFHIVRRDLLSRIPEDPVVLKMAEDLTSSLKSKLEKPVGYTAAPLDARFTTVRLKESNYGNFVCDIMRSFYQADCCIMAAGTIRGDQIYPPGVLRLKDIMNCFPFEDPCVVIRITGQAILHALENAVSTYPALEGRFPQVSNLEFEFDSEKPPHKRILWTKLGGKQLELNKSYKVATRDYMARGKDGFVSLLYKHDGGEAEELVSEENGILISMLLRQYFMSLKVIGQWNHWGQDLDRHWKGVHVDVHESHPIKEAKNPPKQSTEKKLDADSLVRKGSTGTKSAFYDSDSDSPEPEHVTAQAVTKETHQRLIRKYVRRWKSSSGLLAHSHPCETEKDEDIGVDWTRPIAPVVEGRIRMTSNNVPIEKGTAWVHHSHWC